MASPTPLQLILFSQHGMTDNNTTMAALARRVAPPHTHIVAPDLGFIQTHFAITPLIRKVEQAAHQALTAYPNTPARIVATSLGGVLWVEVLSRHPQWWPRFESLILLGSPLGGADMARIVDPLGLGIGIAKPLGQSRRSLAQAITAQIPTLVVAGNTTGGGDGLVPIEATKLHHAHFVCLEGVSHPALKSHPAVVQTILEFWSQPRQPLPPPERNLVFRLIEHFRSVPGITDASERHFPNAKIAHQFPDGTTLRTWTNPVGVPHVFIANPQGTCEYSGFVGWMHAPHLAQAIESAPRLAPPSP